MRPLTLVAGVAFALSMLLGGAGWAEEDDVAQNLTHKRQLTWLLGEWEFHLDLSLTFPPHRTEHIPLVHETERYAIHSISQSCCGLTKGEFSARGRDLKDSSSFSVTVSPRYIGGHRYVFSMIDVSNPRKSPRQKGPPQKFCFEYRFNRTGDHILGYVDISKENEEDFCGERHAIGFLTGARIKMQK